jgi:hypothetical protein
MDRQFRDMSGLFLFLQACILPLVGFKEGIKYNDSSQHTSESADEQPYS